MDRPRAFALIVIVMAALTLGVSRAEAAAISLSLPQSTAFSFLGHSCGGIQEQAYASGFDATSGYPAGAVFLSTSCGGSGRGGGYHTTRYTAWAKALWDFTGAVVSAAAAPAPAVNPTLVAYDAHGNEVYNQSGRAYLVLAPGFVPPARLTGIAPSSGPAAGGTTVTISGTGFGGATGVSFGGAAAQSYTVVSSTSITAVSPASAAGTIDVTVTNVGGSSTTGAADRFTFVAAPVVSGISPSTDTTAGGSTVTISGSGFTGASAVSFGGTAAGFAVASDTTITATVPATDEAGAVDVTVTTVGGTSARSSADRFTYTTPPPAVGYVDPASGPTAGGTVVTILGSSFTGATAVDFGGVPASFSIANDGSITAVSPPGAGTVDITVTTGAGTSAANVYDQFAYVAAPVVAGVSPSAGPLAGGTLVLVTGSGFTGATEVDVGGVPVSFSVQDDATLYALTPAAAAAGPVDVTVVGPGGTSAASAADQFTFVAAPSVSGVSPAAGSVAGGDAVTITGTGFTGVTEVDFGGVPAAFVVGDDGTITATSPPGTAGTVDVTVTGPGGTSAASPADAFTYS